MSTATPSAPDRIVSLLRERALHTGDPIPTEQELIAELGISRNTMREAIRELRTLGIVDVRHGFGTFVGSAALEAVSRTLVFRVVSSPDGEVAGLRELVDMRELIETSMMARLVGTLPAPTIARLRDLCARMSDPELRVEADREFHATLYAHQPNSLVREIVDVFWEAYHAVQSQLREISSAGSQATAERHLAIVDALATGTAAAASDAMREHFADLHERLEAAAAEHLAR